MENMKFTKSQKKKLLEILDGLNDKPIVDIF
jgi:hypothetical protein